MEIVNQIILFLVSLVANMFSAFSGGGAGLFQLPAIIFMGTTFSAALATHKIASVALGVGATVRHWKESHLERRFALFILLSGIPGVILGAMLILAVDDQLARLSLGILTTGLGIYSMLNRKLGMEYKPKHGDTRGYVIGGIVICLLGVLNGSLTSGTGLFVTIWLVSWFGLDYKRAVAYTLVLVGLFWNGTGALVLALQTEVKWLWLPALILGSLLGGYFGAHLSIVSGNRIIKRFFEIATFAIGIKLIIG